MLYVFHVDVGRMLSFDMSVALSSVDNLKNTIERLHGIPASTIVLLVSGGDMLTQHTQVSCYSSGTDTNPIYMFLTGEVKLPEITQQPEGDVDLREKYERCLLLPPIYDTVLTRVQLASHLHDLAHTEEQLSERLVHEQHLQQQGWSAVVANMEDLTHEFRQRYRNFFTAFDRHFEQRGRYFDLLQNFSDDLEQLARIPILPGLMSFAKEDFHGFDDYLDTDDVFVRSEMQQDAELVSGADGCATNKTTESKEQQGQEQKRKEEHLTTSSSAQGDVEVKDGGENIAESCDDKNSTSPNKKLKMGTDCSDEEIGSFQTTDVGATAIANAAVNSTSTASMRNSLNLLQWITSKESHNRARVMDRDILELIRDECKQSLGKFNEEAYESLKKQVQNIIKMAEKNEVKEIKGLSERLCHLEDFKYKIKKMVQDLRELSMSFQHNQSRVTNTGDASILPDLCESHKTSLVVMMQKYNKILDHRTCIAKAKYELGDNLRLRLKHIAWIENTMSEIDNNLLFSHRCLQRAERHIKIIEQIHQAPCIYVAAVTEVVRRKIFSGEFRQWATKLAEDFDVIHSEEIKRRQLFNSSFEGHFLNTLFPGLNDMPPAFANETPLIFDARLPNITKSDIDMLSSYLPDLASQTQLPDMGPVINFFVSRSGVHQKERMEELLKQQMAAVLNAAAGGIGLDVGGGEKPLLSQRLTELQKEAAGGTCCDVSETDTETEFEKVLASMQTVATSTSENQPPEKMARSMITDAPLTQSAATLTDEANGEINARAEVERLRGLLAALSKLSVDCLRMSRANMEIIRNDAQMYREDLQSELQTLADKWKLMRMQSEARERMLLTNNVEREQELEKMRAVVERQEGELETLRQQLTDAEALRTKCTTLAAQVEQLQERINGTQHEKDAAVNEAREKLIHEHKTEIESLRSRFKLMTAMDAQSPSETGSATVGAQAAGESFDMINITQHEAMMEQLRTALEEDRERAISTAVEVERSLWQTFPMNSESVMAKMLEDKERQLDQLREKDLMLTTENLQLKTRIDALTNDVGTSWLREKIDYLQRDNTRLEKELREAKSRRVEMEMPQRSLTHEQSGAVALPRSRSSGSSHRSAVLEGCDKGDIVFVVWNMFQGHFMVVQDSPHLYFLHGDSLQGLNLQMPTVSDSGAANTTDKYPIPLPYFAIGRVMDKEYCQARRDNNRYRVSKGSKFYRIKLAPLSTRPTTRRDRLEFFTTSISRSISQCETHSESAAQAAVGNISRSPAIASSVPMITAPTPSTSANAVKQDAQNIADAPTAATETANMRVGAAAAVGGFQERTTSTSSVTEEDDEPLSLLSEHFRYTSVSEEEEPPCGNSAALTPAPTFTPTPTPTPTPAPAPFLTASATSPLSKILQQSVITEQPTALSTLKSDLLLASADIPQQKPSSAALQRASDATDGIAAVANAATTTATSSNITASTTATKISGNNTGSAGNSTSTLTTASATMTTPEGPGLCSPTIPTLFGTTASEDSDEYRSLEAKDETDFPNSE